MADSTLSNLTSLTLPSQATDLLLVGRGTARPNKVALSDALNSSGLAATTTAYGVVQLAASGGTTAGTVVQANDARLSDTRNPPDGDKGDITVVSGTSWSIDNDAVTYAKMQNVSAASKLLGRGSAAGSGDVEEITLGTGLSMSGTTLSATGGGGGAPTTAEYLVKTADATLSAERVVGDSTSVVANWATSGQVSFERAALTGDVTASANSNSTTIANGVVSTAKLGGDITTAGKALLDDADAAAQRTTLGLGTLATQSGTFSGTSSGTNTGDQTITLTGDVTGSGTGSFAATIANDAVTYAKIQNVSSASKLLGRGDSGSGDVQEITIGSGLAMTGTTLSASGGGGGAPDSADYLVKTANATLSNERVVTDSTSITANWGTAGQVAFERAALTGDVTASANSNATTIADDTVTNAKLANVATSTIKGRVTAGSGDPEDLTGTQATTLLDVFTSSLKGLAPSSGGGTTNFLRADGTWASPAGGGGTSAQVDTYTTTGTVHTWSKPSGAKMVHIICIGAGGGGGGGCGGAAGTARNAGGGGGGGARNEIIVVGADMPSSAYVVVGTGGTAGTGGSSASGTNGTAGGNSTVARNNTNPPTSGIICFAGGGGGAQGGVSAAATSGGSGGGTAGVGASATGNANLAGGAPNPFSNLTINTVVNGGTGGWGRAADNDGGNAEWGGGGGGGIRAGADFGTRPGGNSVHGGGAGGGGRGISTSNNGQTGGNGGTSGFYGTGASPGNNGTTGTAGTAGDAYTTTGRGGGGGGGGGAGTGGTGGAGGAGGLGGGGGGGGGGGTTTGGAGGAGGNGVVIIATYF